MAIRNRTIVLRNGPQLAISQTAAVMAAVVMPAAGRVVAIDAYLVTKTGAGTATIGLYCSDTSIASDAAASSTTLMHSAVLAMTSATLTSATMNTNETQGFVKGEILYLKYNTDGSTTMDGISVTLTINY